MANTVLKNQDPVLFNSSLDRNFFGIMSYIPHHFLIWNFLNISTLTG